MKKILHIINYYQEGFGYQENYLPKCQKSFGFDVKVLTSDFTFLSQVLLKRLVISSVVVKLVLGFSTMVK